MRKSWSSAAWLVLLAAVMAWFFHEALFQRRSLVPADILHQLFLPYSASVTNVSVVNHYTSDALVLDYPWAVFWQRTVKAGELPLWDPYIYGGHPHLAESMTAVFSPFKLLYLILSAERGLTLGIIVEFFLTAFAMFALLRELGRSRTAAFLGSCAWTLNSAFLLWYWRLPAAFTWAPLVLLLIERSVRLDSWRYAAGAGVVLGVAAFSGNAQATVHLGFLCAAWWAMHRHVRLAVVMLAVAVLISAVQWLPTLELMRLDAYRNLQTRGAWASVRHTMLGVPALITFVFPALTGSMETFDLLKLAQATRYDFTGYIGIVPFTLFLIGVAVTRNRTVRASLLIAATVLMIVFFTPFVKYVYHRFFIVVVFAMCVVSAYGTDAALEPTDEQVARIRRVWLVMAGLCGSVLGLVLATQVFIAWQRDRVTAAAQRYVSTHGGSSSFSYKTQWFRHRVLAFLDHYRVSNLEFWLPTLCVFLAGAAWVAYTRRKLSRPVLATVLVLLTVVDLTVLGRRLVPQIDLGRYPLRAEHPTLMLAMADKDLFRVYCDGPNNWFTYGPDWLLASGIADVSGNASLAPAGVGWLLRQAPDAHTSNVVINLVNVRYIFAETTSSPPAGNLEFLAEADGLRVYRNLDCLPRARWVPQAEVVSPAQLCARLGSASFSAVTTALLEQKPAGLGTGEGTGSADVTQYSANHVTVRVSCTTPGLMVLADTYYPGWRARLDGQPVPIYRAYGCVRAVVVPDGEHVVEFAFRPTSFSIGATISLLTMAGLLWIMIDFNRWRART